MIFKLWKNSSKHILHIVFGIAVITCFMFSLFEMGESCMDIYEQALLNTDRFDYFLHNLSAAQMDEIEKVCIESNVAEYFYYYEANEARREGFSEPFYIAGIGGDTDKGVISVSEGRLPQGKNEICITEKANKLLDKPFAIGDIVYLEEGPDWYGELQILDEPTEDASSEGCRIVGFVDDFYLNYNIIFYLKEYPVTDVDSDEIRSSSHIGVLVSGKGYATLEKEGDLTDPVSDYLIKMRKEQGLNLSEIREYSDSRLNLYSDEGSYISFSKSVKALNILIVICGLIFLSGELYNLYLSREETYRILRCLGSSISDIELMMLKEMLMLGFVGTVSGMLFGALMNRIVVIRIISCFFSEVAGVEYKVNLVNILICAGIILFTILFSVFILHLSVRKTWPLGGKVDSGAKKEKRTASGGSALGKYANKESRLNSVFSVLQFLIIMISFVLSTMVVSVIDGQRRQPPLLEKEIPLQIRVGADAGRMFLSAEEISHISEIDGVDGAYGKFFGGDLYGVVDGKKVNAIVCSDGLLKESKIKAGDSCIYISDEPAGEGMAELVASSAFAKEQGMGENEKRMQVKIRNVTKDDVVYFHTDYGENGMLIISESAARELGFSPDMYNTVCIKTIGDVDKVSAEIQDYLGGADKLFVSDFSMRQKGYLQIKGMFSLALYIVVIFLLTIMSIVSLAYRQRYKQQRRDLGILRALGMPLGRVSALFCLGSASVSFKAFIAGLLFAVPINMWLMDSFYETGINPVVFIAVMAAYLLYIVLYGLLLFRSYEKNKTIRDHIMDAE